MTAAPVRAAGRRRTLPARGEIPALDGIRAIAVLLVLAGHAGVPGVAGGFIGVDIFFVLSGFLITSLLLDEFARTGRVDLKGFWIRRARRLLPALLVMTLAVVAARELFPPDAVTSLRDDAVAAFFWVANWAFVAQQADYFSQGAPPSPLQHTWSLGVEEQYYLVWPLLVLFAVLLLRRRGARAVRIAVVVIATAGAAASAACAIVAVNTDTLNRVYFGTDFRAQGLLLGAAAAALLVRDWSALTVSGTLIRARWRRWIAWVLPVFGLAVLGAAAHLATGDAEDFRHGLLIIVAAAAVLVIVPVALDQYGWVARALGWRPLVALGAISYGVYLWHWPLFLILNGERTGLTGWSLVALRFGVTIALAWVSWRFVEQPVRRWRPQHVPMLPLAAATAATAAVVTLTVVPVTPPQPTPLGPDVMSAAAVQPDVGAERPVLGPAPARRAPGTHSVAVFGDSVAWTLMRYLPATPGLAFSNYTTIGCGIARGGPYRSAGETLNQKPECDTWPARWTQRIRHDRPDTVLLMIGRWEIVDRKHEGHWTHIGEDAYDDYLTAELQRALDILGSTGARVVVTTAPYTRRGERADGSLYPEDQPSRVRAWNTILRDVAAKRPNVSVLDFNAKLNPNGAYTARVDGIRMRSDGVHPTAEAVEWLTPWLVDSLKKLPPGKPR
ncbi:acyltransferase family protein [Mycolicibacterium smegmatis]|uniref:Transmembrane acyltransferase n=2 Tax=Mycolicibacterium smegmatis (strain ATCC 700084 / mc(2)155) TaxID=246196 RepID=I7FKJ7_MYCS2|nr:acyltransferase family protein [Mycolicibacterium smegmatis]ABK69984.1 conserved integral membrane protein [Mycolicibacterium smegmatis MC2 155]AFP41825.1 putative transmembrane acyltransferase [Mycolicibacterium smegmatis MC2 155]AIU10555.1 membrane protein [Mycolicibacterium smegmatis MC2 155]AIU17180.1 membrane protein [Mycolicibacterium smegmatis]AIU23803.1 membrane protein [Mycolicibacterium smegmatis]